MYVWGQFIDHDLDLTATDGVTHIDITIPPAIRICRVIRSR